MVGGGSVDLPIALPQTETFLQQVNRVNPDPVPLRQSRTGKASRNHAKHATQGGKVWRGVGRPSVSAIPDTDRLCRFDAATFAPLSFHSPNGAVAYQPGGATPGTGHECQCVLKERRIDIVPGGCAGGSWEVNPCDHSGVTPFSHVPKSSRFTLLSEESQETQPVTQSEPREPPPGFGGVACRPSRGSGLPRQRRTPETSRHQDPK